MRPRCSIGRRSFMARVLGGAALGGGAMALIAGRAHAFGQVTDCDPTDPGGQGTGRRPRTGQTDRDRGTAADPAGCGRGGVGNQIPNVAQRQERCTALATRINELEQRSRQPEGWTDEQLRQAENDQNAVELTIGHQEYLGRQVMRREITSEEANRQMMSLHLQTGALAGRYGIAYAYNRDMFALDAALRILIGRARAAGPQRVALQQERERVRQELQSLNCFN